MEGGDANFTTSATVAGSIGNNIIGSTTGGNVLGGGIGNDTFSVLNNATNTIYTNGGADKITLQAGGNVDVIALYGTEGTTGIAPGGVPATNDNSLTTSTDIPQLGWWGKATGGTTAGYSGGGDDYSGLTGGGTATGADVTVVTNFSANDVLRFGSTTSNVWGSGGNNGINGAGSVLGVRDWDFGNTPTTGNAEVQFVSAGGTANSATDIVFLNGDFTNVQQVAANLANGTYTINFAAALNNQSAHLLIGWQDLAGNAHISDLAVIDKPGGGTMTSTSDTDGAIHVSDMVQLTGFSLASLVSGPATTPTLSTQLAFAA